jgi:hypothetical protein
MSLPGVDNADEHRHPPGDDPLWNESWYFDFVDVDPPGGNGGDGAGLGGYVRIGLYPNLGRVWFWACVVRPGEPLVTVVDHTVPLPGRPTSLELRTTGLWADHTCEEPLERWSLGLEAFALQVDDPADMLAPEPRGDHVAFGWDLEWESDGSPFRYQITDRYELPCRVHGEVQIGQDTYQVDTVGQRDHSWGVRDWWQFGWVWSAFAADDGERLFGNAVPITDDFVFRTGYRQGGPAGPGSPARELEDFAPQFRFRDDGLVDEVAWVSDGLRARVEPLAWSPVLLVDDDGRRSLLPRAMCRATLDDGRTAVGWMEFNQPDGQSPWA